MKIKQHLPYLFWGLGFGFLISRAGATRFDYINSMFLLDFSPTGHALQMFGIIGLAIAVAMPGFAIMRARAKAGDRRFKSLSFMKRRMTPGTIPGAALFGMGWALTGTCPGPAMMQLGEGHWIALCTIAGVFVGQWIWGRLHEKYFDWQSDFCG